MALNKKYQHVRGELKREREKTKVLEERVLELEADLTALRPEIAAMGAAILEGQPKPPGYEHYTWPMIRAIQTTTAKGKT